MHQRVFRRGTSIAATLGLVAVLAMAASVGHAATRTYHIGNSLTWDSKPSNTLKRMADEAGHDLTTGWHIRSSQSLHHIANNPDDVNDGGSAPEPSKFTAALPNNQWDAVTLQPHHTAESTLGKAEAAAKQIIDLTRTNPANQDTTFYIYGAWPRRSQGSSYQSFWSQDVANEDDQPTVHAREYFTHLANRLREDYAGQNVDINMIPVGEVINELANKIDAGEVPGFSDIGEFYRDDTHLDWGEGQQIASATAYATLLEEDPTGLRFHDVEPSREATARIVQSTAWEVVQDHPFTAVPEPTSAAALLLGTTLLVARRRRIRG